MSSELEAKLVIRIVHRLVEVRVLSQTFSQFSEALLGPEGGSQKATLVVVLVVVISSLKIRH